VKPYYRKNGITIYHGDCRDVLPTLPRVNLVLTDPPYGVKWDTDYTKLRPGPSSFGAKADLVGRTKYPPVSGDDKPFDPAPWLKFPKAILWGANCYSNRLPMGRWLIWDKRFANGFSLMSGGEAAWMKGGHGIHFYAETVQGFVRKEKAQHPTQKPIGLMEWCIDKSRTTGLILDPYIGSGTTLVAARNLNRQAIGIEIEERYCEIAAKRLDASQHSVIPGSSRKAA
jgi:site-specific DNA-methyltransferase (adenine-specific)